MVKGVEAEEMVMEAGVKVVVMVKIMMVVVKLFASLFVCLWLLSVLIQFPLFVPPRSPFSFFLLTSHSL